MVLILLLGLINYFGVRIGGDVQVAVTAVKVALIAFVILAGLLLFRIRRGSAAAPLAVPPLFSRLHRRAGGGAVGLRRLEQRGHGGVGSQEPAAQSAAGADCAARSA